MDSWRRRTNSLSVPKHKSFCLVEMTEVLGCRQFLPVCLQHHSDRLQAVLACMPSAPLIIIHSFHAVHCAEKSYNNNKIVRHLLFVFIEYLDTIIQATINQCEAGISQESTDVPEPL